MKRLSEIYPEIIVEIECHHTPLLKAQLLNQQIDLAFLGGPMEDSQVDNLPLCQYSMKWVAGFELGVNSSSISLQQLEKCPLIAYSLDSEHHKLMQLLMSQAGVKSPHIYNVTPISMMVDMVQQNVGFASLPSVLVDQKIAHGELRLLDMPELVSPPINYTASWLRGPGSYIPSVVAQIGQEVAQETHSPSMQQTQH